MEFQKEDIEHLAKLARITLSEHDVQKFRDQLTSVLSYVDQVAGVHIPSHTESAPEASVFRVDEVKMREGNSEAIMKAVPRTEEGHISVLSVK